MIICSKRKYESRKENPPLKLHRRGPKHEQVCLSGNVQNKEQSGYRADEPSTDRTGARPGKNTKPAGKSRAGKAWPVKTKTH
jgi:hypothetical protein